MLDFYASEQDREDNINTLMNVEEAPLEYFGTWNQVTEERMTRDIGNIHAVDTGLYINKSDRDNNMVDMLEIGYRLVLSRNENYVFLVASVTEEASRYVLGGRWLHRAEVISSEPITESTVHIRLPESVDIFTRRRGFGVPEYTFNPFKPHTGRAIERQGNVAFEVPEDIPYEILYPVIKIINRIEVE